MCHVPVTAEVSGFATPENREAAAKPAPSCFGWRYDLRDCYTPPAEFTANHPFIILLQITITGQLMGWSDWIFFYSKQQIQLPVVINNSLPLTRGDSMARKNNARNAVRDGNNEFAKHLYKILSREPGNLIFSPISVHAILSLMYQGSANQTKAAFTDALEVLDLNMAAESYKNIMSREL
ncbi:hypothetical protein NQ318_000806 [Aromia moschata]|uniref:Serpin domain-containing protein n=1 Tax=Aromia moschata TaxID=1265417 RepID=A0AAV8X0U0_9CUCU|nr:hypothetical protein NQ318_000806 [Aromia moschata]